jgi:outer membrane cobalamin receptor
VNRILLLLFVISHLSITELFGQQKENIISGFVKDSITGESLVGTNILLYKDSIKVNSPPLAGCSTNRFGYFVIPSLSSGRYFIIVRHIGYKTYVTDINLRGEKIIENLSIQLSPEDIQLEEVIVKGKKPEKTLTSTIDISPELLAKLPSLSGETDLLKSLEFLPGVNKASEISSGLYIRGGSPDQTLTLVDGVIVYNPAHLGNIASTFNSNAISDVRLIKGAFPAEYGGRLSSILDIKLRSGSKEKEKGTVGIGTINSFATFEGPLKGNSTYMVSGRYMYYDLIQKNFNEKSSIPRYNFFDVNAKLNFVLSERNILSLSTLFSKDHVYNPPRVNDTNYDIEWKNFNLSLNWLQVNTKSLLLNSIFSFINYEFSSKIGVNPESVTSYTYFSNPNLTDFYFRQNAEFKWHQDHNLKLGFEIALHNYDVVYNDIYSSALELNPFAGKNITSIEAALYFQNESEFTSRLKANYGGRFYYFGSKKYFRFEPRISTSYAITDQLFLKSAFAIAHQFLHLIVRNDITLPTELWYPSTKSLGPEKSTQYVLGLDSYWLNEQYEFSIESYYKDVKNIYEFKNNPDLNPFNDTIEEQFISGHGESYGVEFFLNKRTGKFTGWIGYTLSWSKRQFNELNAGRVFYSRYDRRNELSFVLTYEFMKNLSAGATWIYASGQRYSLPPGQYIFDPVGTGGGQEIQFNYTGINSSMFPDYHKLDINFNYMFNWLNKDFSAYINLYNIYNRHNAFAQYITFDEQPDGTKKNVLKRITLFPFIPSIGLIVKL